MTYKLNKEITSHLIEEFDIALLQSRKRHDEIFSTLVSQNPEITCSSEDWDNFSQEIKDNIISRVKKTLAGFSAA